MGKKDYSKRLKHRWEKRRLKEDFKTKQMMQEMDKEFRQLQKCKEYIMPVIEVLFKGKV